VERSQAQTPIRLFSVTSPRAHFAAKQNLTYNHRLLVIGRGARRQVDIEERDIPVALIGLDLAGFYSLGGFVDTGTDYGTQVSATLSFLWRGEKRTIIGAVVPLLSGPDLVLPRGMVEGLV
jgi:hypothetical protein